MKCPVCENELKEYDERCYNCGFSNFRYKFSDQADVFNWLSEVVIPFREYWKAHTADASINDNSTNNIDNESNEIPREKISSCEEVKSTYVIDGNVKWQISFDENNDGAILTHYVGNNSYLKIPDFINGKRIVGLGDRLFSGFSEITAIELPTYLKYIGNEVFYDTKIKSLSIPETCLRIEESAFERSSIENITIPNGCKHIGRAAFKNTNIEEISFPETIEIIEQEVCMGCYKLNKVLIKNATTICADAFNLCRSLKKIHLPESIRVIRKNAFDSTLEDLVLPVGLEKIAFKGSKLEKSSCRIVFKCDDVLFSRSAEQENDFSDIFADMFSSQPELDRLLGKETTPIFYCNAGSNAYKYARNYGISTHAIEEYYSE